MSKLTDTFYVVVNDKGELNGPYGQRTTTVLYADPGTAKRTRPRRTVDGALVITGKVVEVRLVPETSSQTE